MKAVKHTMFPDKLSLLVMFWSTWWVCPYWLDSHMSCLVQWDVLDMQKGSMDTFPHNCGPIKRSSSEFLYKPLPLKGHTHKTRHVKLEVINDKFCILLVLYRPMQTIQTSTDIPQVHDMSKRTTRSSKMSHIWSSIKRSAEPDGGKSSILNE